MEDYCVVVSKNSLKEVRKYLSQLEISDLSRRLQSNSEDDSLAVPINITKIKKLLDGNVGDEDDLCQVIYGYLSKHISGQDFSVKKKSLPLSKKMKIKTPETKLKERLQMLFKKTGMQWSHTIAQEIPSHWERHGDLVLIPASSFTSSVWRELGNELWACVASCLSCKRIAVKDVVSTNGYRSPQVCMLYGDNGWVVQTDNGIKYTYDITKCMFSSGNITEKLRVANFDCTGEVVVDLYAGIGYFSLPYLVYTNAKHLHACEWNPDAVEALRKSLRLNKVEDRCTVHHGDNREVCPKGIANRVNLGLIPSSRDGWPIACAALNPQTGGILHIHHNVNIKPRTGSGNDRESSRRDPFLCEDRLSALEAETPAEKFSENNEVMNNMVEDKINENSKPILKVKCDKNDSFTEEMTLDGDSVVNLGIDDCNASMIADNREKSKKSFCDAGKLIVSCESFTVDNTLALANIDENIANKTSSNNIKSLIEQISSLKINPKCSKWLPWAQEVAMEIKNILEELHNNNWKTLILHIEPVKSYAPHIDHIVLDLECKPQTC